MRERILEMAENIFIRGGCLPADAVAAAESFYSSYAVKPYLDTIEEKRVVVDARASGYELPLE